MGVMKDKSSQCQDSNPTGAIPTSASKKASQRWSLLRNAIVKSATTQTVNNAKKQGSIHQFAGFGLLNRQRLPRSQVSQLQKSLTNIRLNCSTPDHDDDDDDDLVESLELALLALTALRPAEWTWEFCIEFPSKEDALKFQNESETSSLLDQLEERLSTNYSGNDPKQGLRLGKGSGWLPTTTSKGGDTAVSNLKIVLSPFVPSQGIFQYTLPSFDDEKGEQVQHQGAETEQLLFTRERLNIAPASLRELTSHHHNKGVDNTGNICVWDSEQTMAFGLLKTQLPWWPKSKDEKSCLDILELGAGMAGLAGLAMVQKLQKQGLPFRLWLTDGHPQAVHNNKVHAHIMTANKGLRGHRGLRHVLDCCVLPWSVEPLSKEQCPPPCKVAIVSDCTHFQEFHAHLFFTLAHGLTVGGYGYMCQPHRGKSLNRFLDLVETTSGDASNPLFSIQWLEIPELHEADKRTTESDEKHYNPDIHYPHWILLRKLRQVQQRDHCRVTEHMSTRDRL